MPLDPWVPDPENARIAEWLREAAGILHAQGANPFRVGAYRKAADTIEMLPGSVRALFDAGGLAGLDPLPGIGGAIASAIAEMLTTGRWTTLDRLRGTVDPVALFQTLPSVGPALARNIHDQLGVDTLEALEVAAHDGRLAGVRGVGPRRAALLRAALGDVLDRSRLRRRPSASGDAHEPPVDVLLDVDQEYRASAAAGILKRIAPRRFNPAHEAWLPVLHAARGSWHFTALYSNTPRAHELNRTHDWVIVYFHDDDRPEMQRTIVTELRGPLAGKRVVRGREAECARCYAGETAAATA